MNRNRIISLLLVALFFAGVLYAGGTAEAVYPDPEKNITIVVPHAAGGSTDLIFRTLAEEMKRVSGANFLVTNITGAGSATGTNEVINNAADGYMFQIGRAHV